MSSRACATITLTIFLIVNTGLPAAATAPIDPVPSALKRWAATMGGPQDITADQAIETARHFDVIVGHPRTFRPHTAAMRQENPNLRFLAYMNGAYAQESEGDVYPPDLYLRSSDGNKVRSTEHGNYLMDITARGWIDDVSAECAGDTGPVGWDGCYLDMLGPGTLTLGYVNAAPINSRTGMAWDKPQWMAATSALAAEVQADNPSLFIMANGLGTGKQFFQPDWGPTNQLLDQVKAGNAQGFVRGTNVPIDEFRKEHLWRMDVDMLVEAASRGRSVFTMTKIWGVPATRAEKNAVHRFSLATFLLGTDGNQFFFWSDDGDQGANPQRHRYDTTNVGQPLGPYVKTVSGAYVREFTDAIVVVNPGGATVSVDLGATMKSLQGDLVSSVNLRPQTGDVFTR